MQSGVVRAKVVLLLTRPNPSFERTCHSLFAVCGTPLNSNYKGFPSKSNTI